MFLIQQKFGIVQYLQNLTLNSQTQHADECVSAAL